VLIVTVSHLEGRRVTRYLGLVTGEAILGANVFKDLFAGIRDIVGGRSAAYEKIREMTEEAQKLGANGILAVDLDYEEISPGQGTMLMVSASGTAVVIE